MFSVKVVDSTTEYYVVEHNPELFAVMSKVTTTYAFRQKREFINFVAEATTKEAAHNIIKLIKG